MTDNERKWVTELMNKELNNFEKGKRFGQKQELEKELKLYEIDLQELLHDERIHYKPALVQVNAPLALIQVGLETERTMLNKNIKRIKERLEELKGLK